jgi:DNA-binding transcriptional MerR regulator
MKQATTIRELEPILTCTEARKLCGDVSYVTFWRWERDGLIPPAIRINKRKYWTQSMLQEVRSGRT